MVPTYIPRYVCLDESGCIFEDVDKQYREDRPTELSRPTLHLDCADAPCSGRSRYKVVSLEFRSGEPPKSRIRVGFGFRVSGFGFRVSSIETNFRCRFRVSGFGFRRLKPTNFRCRFRVSGFGFLRLKPTFAVGFGFRVSIGPGEVKSSESVSGFGFRVSIGPGEGI